jgi:hypothetical protein
MILVKLFDLFDSSRTRTDGLYALSGVLVPVKIDESASNEKIAS